MTRMRIWAKIAVTVAANLILLGALGAIFLVQQARNGPSSFLYSSARERIRELGARVEQEFPGKPNAERTAWLASVERPWGVKLSVYDDTGALVAGPDAEVPEAVMREIRRDRSEPRPQGGGTDNTAEPRPPPDGPPMFLIRQERPSRYWIGYHFPITMMPGNPPVRHTLTVMAPSLLAITLFADWGPWLAGSMAALLMTALCWTPLIRRLTRSIQAVRSASAEIAAGRFDVEIQVKGSDELGDLAQSVRRMSTQLSRLVHGQKRFLADVAHELCAPLARIQLSTGILAERAERAEGASAAADREHLARLERDVAQMSVLVGDLLSFTRGAARKPSPEPIGLAQLVEEVAAQENPERRDVQVEIEPSVRVLADREYVARAVANVVRNAICYAGGAGPIRIGANRVDRMVRLTVEDSGPGLPEEDLDAVFRPFYRVDAARTPGIGGSGLGLAIVKQCVEECGGFVFCRNGKRGGLQVVMALPEAR